MEEKEKLKSSQELDFIGIVEDQKPDEDTLASDGTDYVSFCKDCKEVTETKEEFFRGKKVKACEKCGGTKVVNGIERSLKKYFRVS